MSLLCSRKHHGAYEKVRKSIVTKMEVGDSGDDEERKGGEGLTMKWPARCVKDFGFLS